MNTTERIINWYDHLLCLYPRSFRETFGEEIRAVFAQAARDAESRVWAVFLRELFDLPFNLIREYISAPRLNHFIERMLTHKKRTRWQQAGALGFALAFALLELLHGLPQLWGSEKAFASWWGLIRAAQGNIGLYAGEVSNTPVPADFVWLALSGLVAGTLFSLAQGSPLRTTRLRFAIGGSAALVVPYLLLFLFNTLPEIAALPSGPIASIVRVVIILVKAIIILALVGGLPGVVLGRLAGIRGGRDLSDLVFVGLGGLVLGIPAGLLADVVPLILLALVGALLNKGITPPATSWEAILIGNLFLSVVFGAVLGWVYGGFVGQKIGRLLGVIQTTSG